MTWLLVVLRLATQVDLSFLKTQCQEETVNRLVRLLFCSFVITFAVHDGMAAGFNCQSVSTRIHAMASANPIIKIADARGPQGGTPKDQYRQMGSIAAIAEACYGSKAIPEKLQALIKKASQQNPSSAPVINLLINDYNEAYLHAATEMTVWSGSDQSYSSTPFHCELSDDVEFIKKWEATLLNNLR